MIDLIAPRKRIIHIGRERTPFVSVIIPAKNEERFLKSTLKIIRRSDYPKNKIEIIVVDDNSKDRTVDIAKKYADKVLINRKTLGKSLSINLAARKARGDFVYILDADTWIKRGTIRRLVQGIDKDHRAVVGHSYVRNVDILVSKIGAFQVAFNNSLMENMSKIFKTEIVPGFSILIDRKILLKLGFKRKLTEDINFSYRMYKHNFKIKLLQETLCSTDMPDNLKDYRKQQERWKSGGLNEIRYAIKKETIWNDVVKLPFVVLSAILPVITVLMFISFIVFYDYLSLYGFLIGALVMVFSYFKYEKKQHLRWLEMPLILIAFALLELFYTVDIIMKGVMGLRIRW